MLPLVANLARFLIVQGFFNFFFFLHILSCLSNARIKEERRVNVWSRPALKPLANKSWSPVQHEREERERENTFIREN